MVTKTETANKSAISALENRKSFFFSCAVRFEAGTADPSP
jgi:hypothetical protein